MIGVGNFKTTNKMRKYVKQVLDTERLSYGPFLQNFESRFASIHACKFGIMTNSGTSSLLIALAALKNRYNWQDGDEVIVPAVTFIATSNIVLQLNLKPVFVDVEADYYGLDVSKIEAAITERTRCIIPVHLFGQPCNIEEIVSIAKRHNLRIIEDSCETMFAAFNGRSVGSFGDIGCFSTYVAHILVTGVGGICTTNDPQLAVDLRSLMNHGRDSIYISIDDDDNLTTEQRKIVIAKRFSFIQMGYSFRVTELEGALGLAGLEDYKESLSKRRSNARYLTELLKPLEAHLQLPQTRSGADHSFMMFPLVMKQERKEDITNFLENGGVETRDMLPLINQPFYVEKFKLKDQDYPCAAKINSDGFYVGCHPGISQEELEYMAQLFHSYFKEKKDGLKKYSFILMSNLKESEFDSLKVQSIVESIPLDEFEDLILANSEENNLLSSYLDNFGFISISQKADKNKMLLKAMGKSESEYFILMGIDGTDNPVDINKIMIKLRLGSDLVIASRFTSLGRRAFKGLITKGSFGNRFFAFLVSLVSGGNVTDTNNMYRGFNRSVISKLNLHNYGDNVMFAMTVGALFEGLSVSEVPTQERMPILPVRKKSRVLNGLLFFAILCRRFFKQFFS